MPIGKQQHDVVTKTEAAGPSGCKQADGFRLGQKVSMRPFMLVNGCRLISFDTLPSGRRRFWQRVA